MDLVLGLNDFTVLTKGFIEFYGVGYYDPDSTWIGIQVFVMALVLDWFLIFAQLSQENMLSLGLVTVCSGGFGPKLINIKGCIGNKPHYMNY